MTISTRPPLLNTIVKNRYSLRIIAFVFAFLCIVVFNLKNPAGPSSELRAYDQWVGIVERNESDAEGKPLPISISLISKDSERSFSWTLTADSVAKRRTIVRILQLLREAEIETLYPLKPGAEFPSPDEHVLLFTTQNDSGAFYAEIPPHLVSSSIQLQNMIKLFQVVSQ